jgi:hypothetical protein
MKTVTGVFPSILEAELAIRDLEYRGIPSDSINLIAGNDKNRHDEYLKKSKEASTSAGAAAVSGASFGGGVGIVTTLVALAIPGVGPIIAGGAMTTVLAGMGFGAVAGGLLGTFKNMGIPHEDAPLYEEAVRRGAVIAIAHVDDAQAADATSVMEWRGAHNIRREADTWRANGWPADPHPFVSDDSIASHKIPDRGE